MKGNDGRMPLEGEERRSDFWGKKKRKDTAKIAGDKGHHEKVLSPLGGGLTGEDDRV